ncbi:MAG TPA: phage major capsid protein [Streptosporangiaceae bacterium]
MTKVNAPTSPAGLQEDLNDPEKFKAIWEAGPDGLKAYIQGYAGEFAKADRGDVDEQIRGQVGEQLGPAIQSAMGDYLKEHPVASPAAAVRAVTTPNTPAGRALYHPDALGNKLEGIFDSPAELFQALLGSPRTRARLAAKTAAYQQIVNSFGSEVPDAGGFLIPEVLRSEILSVALETAVVRPRATVIPMNSLRVPIPILDDTSHVSNVFGGVQWYWTEEAAALTESQATFGRVVLDAKKLTAYAAVPNELMDDAPAFNGFLGAKFPQAIAFGEDVAFFNGTGVGEPMGFINAECSVSVAKQAGQATNTIVWENIVGQYAQMLPTSLGRAVWIANINTFPELATMALSVGTGGGPVWIGSGYDPGNSGSVAPPATILGRPLIFTEKPPGLTTTGDIVFADLSYYLIGDRMAMTAMTSDQFLFSTDKIAFRVIERVDGRPWLQSAITPHNGTQTLSPFVQIATR